MLFYHYFDKTISDPLFDAPEVKVEVTDCLGLKCSIEGFPYPEINFYRFPEKMKKIIKDYDKNSFLEYLLLLSHMFEKSIDESFFDEKYAQWCQFVEPEDAFVRAYIMASLRKETAMTVHQIWNMTSSFVAVPLVGAKFLNQSHLMMCAILLNIVETNVDISCFSKILNCYDNNVYLIFNSMENMSSSNLKASDVFSVDFSESTTKSLFYIVSNPFLTEELACQYVFSLLGSYIENNNFISYVAPDGCLSFYFQVSLMINRDDDFKKNIEYLKGIVQGLDDRSLNFLSIMMVLQGHNEWVHDLDPLTFLAVKNIRVG